MNLSSYLIWLFVGLAIGLSISINLNTESITLQKSSDSDWEVSDKRMPDTTITDTLVISGVTVYPTIQYLNVKLK